VLTNEDRHIAEFDDALVLDHQLTRVAAADGRPRESLSLYDLTRNNDIGFELLPVTPVGKRRKMDLFHANAIEPMRRPELVERHPLYGLGNLLVTLRHQNSVIVVDAKEKRLVWSWGQGELLGPHDANVLPNGNLLIFDNGLTRDWSRVIELDPLSEEIVWEYPRRRRRRFLHTRTRIEPAPGKRQYAARQFELRRSAGGDTRGRDRPAFLEPALQRRRPTRGDHSHQELRPVVHRAPPRPRREVAAPSSSARELAVVVAHGDFLRSSIRESPAVSISPDRLRASYDIRVDRRR
jgi:hypothetical protein